MDSDKAAASPISDAERIVTLDFVRGIALMGILFANITAYAQPYAAYAWPPALAGGMTAGDQAIWLFQFTFVDAKFRGLFTLLFGAGLCLFHERAEARGEGITRQFVRLLVLLTFGLAHYFLLWRGDILALYAVWGLVALPALNWGVERQAAVGLLALLVGVGLMSAMWWGVVAEPGDPFTSAVLGQAAEELSLYREGSYGEIVAHTVAEESGALIDTLIWVGLTETFGLILLGMALYRAGLFTGGLDAPTLRWWGWIGAAGGIAGSCALGLWPLLHGFPYGLTHFVFSGLGAVPHLATTLGLAALLALWAPRAAASRLGRRLAACGRTAFSNYLGLSLVMVPLFHGWGLGLFGQFHRIELLGFVVAGWGLMLAWSQPWLARFRYGPLEWLWRCLTYGKPVALRR